MDDRRRHRRQVLNRSARVDTLSEQQLPEASTIDISLGGLLLAFDEPVGFALGDRLIVSIDFVDGPFHVVGAVNRVERGADFHVYVALAFSDLSDLDTTELDGHLRRCLGDTTGEAGE